MMKPLEHEHENKGCPNLDPKRVLARPDKRLHLPEGIRSCKVTEEHRYELGPGSKALGAALRFMFGDQFVKVHGGKDLRKDLIHLSS